MTGESCTTLVWMSRDTKEWHHKTIQHCHSSAPVPVLHTSTGFTKYNAYCAAANPADDACCYSTRVLTDRYGEGVSPHSTQPEKDKGLTIAHGTDEPTSNEAGTYEPNNGANDPQDIALDTQLRPTPLPMEFQAIQVSDDTPHIIEDEEVQFKDSQQELLHWHHRLGHMPFTRLKEAAEVGIIPRRLRHVKAPKCTACMYAKATKKPWWTKAPPTGQAGPPVNASGEVVSFEQLESSTPGFIG